MQLVERRIGLLFAVFLLALAIGATKAAWLGVVKAGPLKRAAVIQQEADVEIPARRGSITDVNGNDLAVSEPAVDIAATTYLIKDVTKAARQLAPLIGVGEDVLLRKLAKRSGFVYLGRAIPAAKADQIQKLEDPRAGVHPALQALLPARLDGLAAARLDRHRRPGPRRAGGLAREAAHRHRRRAQAGQGRDGRADRDARRQARPPRPQRPPDARLQHPGPRRAGAQRGRQDVEAQGRDRAGHGPQQRGDPRAGELAGA